VISAKPPAAAPGPLGEAVKPAIYVLPASNSAGTAASAKWDASQAANGNNLPPIVKPENTRRPPPAKKPAGQATPAASQTTTQAPAQARREVAPKSDSIPAPPMPFVPKEALLASAKEIQPSSPTTAEKSSPRSTKPSSTTPASPAEPSNRPKTGKPGAARIIRGAKFGTGMVAAIHLKEGVALLEFAGEAAVPPGSIVRTYHDFALSSNTVVCDLEVVRGEAGLAAAVARPGQQLKNLAIGDRAIVLR